MCNVCLAIELINGKILKVKSIFNKKEYGIQSATRKQNAEHGPCFYRLVINDNYTSIIESEEDLASIVQKGGFDISPEVRQKEHDQWIESKYKHNLTVLDVLTAKHNL